MWWEDSQSVLMDPRLVEGPAHPAREGLGLGRKKTVIASGTITVGLLN